MVGLTEFRMEIKQPVQVAHCNQMTGYSFVLESNVPLLSFSETFPFADRVKKTTNRRSTYHILKLLLTP
jgi:hypothetical protein